MEQIKNPHSKFIRKSVFDPVLTIIFCDGNFERTRAFFISLYEQTKNKYTIPCKKPKG